jgi:GNAT superfamily N-acetyltransferase
MPVLEIKLDPTEDDRKAILNPLLAFNDLKAGQDSYKPLAILLRDDEGEIRGGLWAKCYYGWLFIELLFVPEVMRGQQLGVKLLAQAEQWAKEERCVGIWLDTFSFQAPGSRLQAPGSRLQAPGSRLQAPGSRLQAPGSRLQAPGSRLL